MNNNRAVRATLVALATLALGAPGEPLPETTESGTVSGTLSTATDLAARHAISPGKDVPSFPDNVAGFGYKWNHALMPTYSDGRWFKRTNHGKVVCIDMRKEQEEKQ